MMIRLVVSDLDGTLLDEHGELPSAAFDAIARLHEKGIRFAPCSGRQLTNMRGLFAPVDDLICYVGENGAICADSGRVLSTVTMSKAMSDEMISDLRQNGMELLLSGCHTCYIFADNRAYADDIVYRLRNTVTVIRDLSEVREPVLKVSGYKPENLLPFCDRMREKWRGRCNVALGGEHWLDFTLSDKGTGLKRLCADLGIDPQDTAAFGDYFNDEPMLDAVGHPYLMCTAPDRLHKPGYTLCGDVVQTLNAIADSEGEAPHGM